MSQENVEGETEALDELVLLSHASFVVKRSEPYPNERWLLLQGGSPVAAIEPTGSGWALTTPPSGSAPRSNGDGGDSAGTWRSRSPTGVHQCSTMTRPHCELAAP